MSNGILMEMTIDEVRQFAPEVVVFGVGSVEPHGPVLPYGTDYFQCDGVVRRGVELANRRNARALMYPTLPIGNNVNFKAWPFACRIRVQTLMQVLGDIFSALAEDGIRKIVVYDGHGGNTDAIRAALRAHVDSHPPNAGAFVCMVWSPPEVGRPPLVEHPSDHGGESETSRMLYLRGDLVHKDKFDVFPFGKLSVEALSGSSVYFVRPWHRHVPVSAGGDVRKATAEKGRQIVEGAAEHLARLLVELSQAKWSDCFPYEPQE